MKIINTNTHPVSVLVSIHGKEDYVTVMLILIGQHPILRFRPKETNNGC
jgi:hypothetical protein